MCNLPTIDEEMRKRVQKYLLLPLMAVMFASFSLPALGNMPTTTVLADHCGEDEVEVGVEVDGTHCIQNSEGLENNAIVVYLRYFIQFLTAGVGLVITIMIAVAGFQYITARDNPQAVQAAKDKIWNAIIALILFILMYAILSYLVPIEIF